MRHFDFEWITLDNGIRLKIANIIGYHRNADQGYTKIMTSAGDGTIFPANETPDELDVLLGKTVYRTSSAKCQCCNNRDDCEEENR